MTKASTRGRRRPFLAPGTIDYQPWGWRSRFPVATFVALGVVVIVVLSALAWTGAVAPRVHTSEDGETVIDGRSYRQFSVENLGSLPLDLRSARASWSDVGEEEGATPLLVRPARRPHPPGMGLDTTAEIPATLEPQQALVFLVPSPTCLPPGMSTGVGTTYEPHLVLVLGPAAGPSRKVEVRGDVQQSYGGPDCPS